MKTALLLPDGVGVRNFLLGSFRDVARGRLALSVLNAIPESSHAIYENGHSDHLEWIPYRAYRDTPRLFMLRNALNHAHMYSIDTWGMRCMRERPIIARGKRRWAAETARWLGQRAAQINGVGLLDRRLRAAVETVPETAHYRQLFERNRPDVLLCSNQRPTGILPIVLAARSLGIPTVTCIFSWDNLTSKARIAAPFDHYFVWSDLMGRELREFYPEIAPERIHVVGSPQFDPHTDARLLLSREAFFAQLGADPSRPLLCYSSGEPNNSPEDQDHLALLMRSIREGRIGGNPQVVVRPTPTVEGHRFDAVRAQYPELIYSRPEWISPVADDWTQMIPLPSDVALLANLAHHADMNISVASTMTLDFAIHNRPIVNVAFDIADPPPFKMSLWDYYYRFEHYRPVVQTGAALFSRSAEQYVQHINQYLAHPELHAVERRRLLDMELGVPAGQSSRRVVDALLEIVRHERHAPVNLIEKSQVALPAESVAEPARR